MEIFEWAEKPTVTKEAAEEAPVCNLDDEGCLTCGS